MSKKVNKIRVYVAWVILIGSLIAWPVTQLTIAKGEPVFTLALSWLAVILTSADFLSTSEVKRDQDNDN